MSEFVVPGVEEISVESDRTVLTTAAEAIKAYGASLKADMTAENLEVLRELADAAAAEAEATAAAERDALAAKFSTPAVETAVVEKTPERELRIPLMTKEDKEELAVAEKTVAEKIKGMIVNDFNEGVQVTDPLDFGTRVIEAHKQAYKTRGSMPGSEKVRVFSSQVKLNDQFTASEHDAYANMKLFRDVVIPSAKLMAGEDEDTLVASGGYCAPLNTDYTIPSYSEICSTLEDFLPSVAAPRGGIKFIRPGSDTTAAGIAVITADQDAAGYDCETPAGTTPCKPTTKVSCPTTEEARIDMISQSITFGNLNYRTFPEHIDWALHELAVNFNRVKQQYLLDKFNLPANVTVMTPRTARYNAVSDLMTDLTSLGASFRNDIKRCFGSGLLNLMLPRYVVDILKFDLWSRENSFDYMTVTEADIARWFRAIGYNVFFYEGRPTGKPTLAALSAGTTPLMPVTGRAFIFDPGSFVILNGGVLNLGIVRDHILNHANNLEMFSEEFIGLVRIGLKAVAYDFSLVPTGGYAGTLGAKAYA